MNFCDDGTIYAKGILPEDAWEIEYQEYFIRTDLDGKDVKILDEYAFSF